MTAPRSFILCMAKSGRRDSITQAKPLTYIKVAIYIIGHRHTWSLMSTEMQGLVIWMCRGRGFKDHGEHETVKGFEVQKLGHTITAIFDSSADTETGF